MNRTLAATTTGLMTNTVRSHLGSLLARRLLAIGHLSRTLGHMPGCAPAAGAAFRQSMARRVNAVAAPADLAEEVRRELAHSTRTWHLPQPSVIVVGGRVTLTGEVPPETARADLGRTAGAVVGVSAVDNQITVTVGEA